MFETRANAIDKSLESQACFLFCRLLVSGSISETL